MKKPIVGIVGRIRKSDTGYDLIATPESERLAVIESGGNPLLILPPQSLIYNISVPSKIPRLTDTEKKMLTDQIDLCDGILLPGGDMMFEYDRVICKHCIDKDVPLLGICMGLQVMCTYDRSVNLEKIETNINHKNFNDNLAHDVQILKSSKLRDIIGETLIGVNSRHSFKVIDSGGYKVAALSDDGVIEAVEMTDKKFNIGIQWHPELNFEIEESSKKLFQAFIKSCKDN